MLTPFDRLKTCLVDEWKGSWKLWSVQINALGLLLMGLGEALRESWTQLPSDLATKIPHSETIGMVMFGLGLVARVLKQGGSKTGDGAQS